jgi:hypothetical protein
MNVYYILISNLLFSRDIFYVLLIPYALCTFLGKVWALSAT